MQEYIAFMFDSFWHFVGSMLLLSLLLSGVISMWKTFWRHLTIKKHGYPPTHCDADGDFKQEIPEIEK